MAERVLKEGLVETLAHLLAVTANEATLWVRMEDFYKPRPATLARDDAEARKLELKLTALCRSLGGPPGLISVANNEPRPTYETYPSAAVDELLAAFHTSRRLVCKAHTLRIAFPLVKQHPEFWEEPQTAEEAGELSLVLEKHFWEEVENSLIRLAAFWDRAGQLLDFAFFKIRQYERDGFPAVMDRIRKNAIPMCTALADSDEWRTLWRFKNSEHTDGLIWLLRRRNLLVHSLHLRPRRPDSREDPIFDSAYNHLQASIQRKLRQASAELELEHLHGQLQQAADQLANVLTVAEYGARLNKDVP